MEFLNSHGVNGCINVIGGGSSDLARDSIGYVSVLPPTSRPGTNNGIKNQVEDHFLVA